jgi:sortase (surface protein transpeptidase)/transcriptional regulator with XRE-family HTH domain
MEGVFDITSPEFAIHLGSLLAATRRRDGRSIRDVAVATGGQFGPGRLRRLERGSVPLDDSVIEIACRVYGADLGTILPSRMAITIENHVMIAGGVRLTFERDDPTSVLTGYLRLVRSMRDQQKAPAITLRRDDIERLAAHLDLDGAQVIDRLASLMGATAAQRIAIGSLFAAGAIVVGLVAAGNAHAGGTTASVPSVSVSVDDTTTQEDTVATVAQSASTTVPTTAIADPTPLVGVAESSPATTIASSSASPVEAPAPIPATTTEISGAADSAGLEPAVRVQVPVAATPETTVPTGADSGSGCNTDPGAAVMSLTIADLSYDCPVYAGGQSQIDAGFVTLVTDAGANAVLATRPGDPGTLWLAGHRTTHGAAFADVPDLADGALVTVADGGTTATYRVVGRAYVEVSNDRVVDASGNATALATWESIIRTDLGGDLAPRLVLQTCDGSDFRWMIYADLVTG